MGNTHTSEGNSWPKADSRTGLPRIMANTLEAPSPRRIGGSQILQLRIYPVTDATTHPSSGGYVG